MRRLITTSRVALWACGAALWACGLAQAQIEFPERPPARPPAPPVDAPPSPEAAPEVPAKPEAQNPAPQPEAPRELPPQPRGNLAERVIGKNPYVDPSDPGPQAPPPGGVDLPAAPASSGSGPLSPLSPGAPGPAVQGEPRTAPTGAAGGGGGVLDSLPVGRKDAARFIYEQLDPLQDVHHALIAPAVQSLMGLGPDGVEASRAALAGGRPASILAAAQVLLSSAEAADRELVRRRLSAKLPASVGGPLVDLYATLDPVSASPAALAALLDHPLVGVRATASRRLAGVVDPALFQALLAVGKSERADTRLRAMELAAPFESSEAGELLMARLRDPAANVAGRAALLLAARENPAVVGDLRRLAFDQPWILRESAYAILSLVEREDARLVTCFDERHVPILLEGLEASDPFVSGTCAAALAGLGFRLPSAAQALWLDGTVPERLVRCVGGVEFHNDFSSLQRPAARRLTLISGQAFGSDGPAWMQWWGEVRATFRARRAVIDAGPDLSGSLRILWRNDGGVVDAFEILGPTAAGSRSAPETEVLRITELQARDVYSMLSEARVFSAERLPGVRGSSSLAGRTLEVGIADQGKSFRFAGSTTEPWFETVGAALQALRERNRWQRYPSPARHARAEDLWFEQFAWWDAPHSDAERALRLKGLVLEALPSFDLERRAGGIAELASIYAVPAHIEESDFPVLRQLLAEEPFYTPRAVALLELCLAHLRAFPALGPAGGEELVQLALGRFGDRAPLALTAILKAAGPERVRAATLDSRPLLRAVAVDQLLELGTADDVSVARAMQDDPALEVQIAAVTALGAHRVEAARDELLIRARLAQDPGLRAAALGAVANLGGEGVIDVIVLGLASPVASIKVAAARGLARVGDPSAAPLLISLLGQGRGTDLYEAARQGLLALGPDAVPDLLRAINTPGHRARREGALLLSQQGVPEAVPVLLALLSDAPADSLLAAELAVATCVDFRQAGDPAVEWWDWWEGVVHDDPAAWLCAAGERLGVSAPDPKHLARPGTRQSLRFLVAMLRRPEPHLVERARRDLGRLLERELGPLPPPGEGRNLLLLDLEREIGRRFPQ